VLETVAQATVLKGLPVSETVAEGREPSVTVTIDLGKMNPREFYNVCFVAGHPPLIIKPYVDRSTGNILKGQFDVAFGVDFFR
jgi:hypothetical protein